ncbi:MAG: CHAD domain-containing protein [Elusimicrobia bacterium]|nr:CHAD domain-containing protein [Elusimicrobiota bacterium]
MRLPRGLPEKPVAQAAALLALHRLHAASEAAKLLAKASDPEALHDLRVGLRRLRVVVRAYAPSFEGALKRKTVKALRRLAKDTNSARDAEVLEGMLKAWGKDLHPSRKPGFDALLAKARKSAPEDGRAFISSACRDFTALEAGLREDLSALAAGPPAETETFGERSADRLRQASRLLAAGLRAIQEPSDDEHIHEARIAGKGLRYLLEPFLSRSFLCRKAVGHLKKLQDDLGTMHDLNLLLKACRRCAKKAASSWAVGLVEAEAGRAGRPGRAASNSPDNPVPGLVHAACLARQERLAAFKRFTTRWDPAKTGSFFREVEDAASILVGRMVPQQDRTS